LGGKLTERDLQDKIATIILTLLGLFIAYQLLKVILGGSWQSESIIIAFLVFNLGLSWKINSNIWKVKTKLEGHMGWHKGKDSK